ncbi:MAG: acyl dehydratase [Desulfobacterales bacterium]|nr:acyl dehydratase [Desulfobacterales bacterium]
MSAIRRRAIEGIEAGDTFTVTRCFSEADTVRFGELTRDYNPVHHDDRFALAKGLPGRICHGLLIGALLTEIGGQIGWLASGMSFRFLGPVSFDETVSCTLTVHTVDPRGKARASAEMRAGDGRLVATAELFGLLPSAADRAVMQRMVDEGDPSNPLRS